jgi:hypothetical protein
LPFAIDLNNSDTPIKVEQTKQRRPSRPINPNA